MRLLNVPTFAMDSPHHRTVLSNELIELETMLLEMSSKAGSMLSRSVEALINLDVDQAMAVIHADDEVDALDLAIEEKCLRLLALQQPMASDLREIGTLMKMITDIERISDLAVDIAKAGMKIEKELGQTGYVDIRRIANLAQAMLAEALEAFTKRDLNLVNNVIAKDDQVDETYRDLRAQIHSRMREDPNEVVAASWLLIAIHHIERIADHTVNIAERVAFMVTGEFRKLVQDDAGEPT